MNIAKSIAAVVIIFLFASLAASQAAEKKPSQKAASGRYRLVKGKGYTVCEAFLKNLNAFPPEEPPMVCEQKIHPTHPEFSKPEWEEMDVQNNLRIVYAAESKSWRFTKTGEQPMPYDQWLKAFQERIKSGESKPRLRRTTLTLNEKGPEVLISYEPMMGECMNGGLPEPGGYIFVLRDEAEAKLEKITGMNARYDTFLFDGKPYFVSAISAIDRARSKENQTWIWYIRFGTIFPGVNNDGDYVQEDRCAYHVDKLKNGNP